MITNIIRVGVVSSVSASKMAVRVVFADKDDMVTDWLPIVVFQTMSNKDFVLPVVGETAVCLFLGNGIESGFYLGSIYSSVDKPPTSDANKRGIWFEDGSYVEYDRSTGAITVEAKGDVHIKGNLIVDGTITRGGVSV